MFSYDHNYTIDCKRSELSGLFSGPDFRYIYFYISGLKSFRKCAISLSAMPRKCYSILVSEGRLSKCRVQDRQRAREHRASETAAQRGQVSKVPSSTYRCLFLSQRREACLPYLTGSMNWHNNVELPM